MAELFDIDTIARLFGSYVTALQVLAENPDAKALSADVIGPEEADLLLQRFQGKLNPSVLEAPFALHQFEKIVEQQPDARCLVFEASQMTYSEVRKFEI